MVLISDLLRLRLASAQGITREQIEAATRLQGLGSPRIVQARATIEEEREPRAALFLVRRGWAFSSKLLPNGARQIVDFHVAGDLVGAGSAFLATAQQTCETVTETLLTEIPVDVLRRSAQHSPALLEVLLWLVADERVALTDRLVDLGRRDSAARVAHLLLELWRRLFTVGIATRSGYACPLSQYLIADATGLTAIHVNRVLRELRESGLLTFRHGTVQFHDFTRLAQMTGFDQSGARGRPPTRPADQKGAA